MEATSTCPSYSARDYKSEVKPVWCPGCGDYSVLGSITKALAELSIPPERVALVSGIGCSSRLPAYTNVFGFHGVHGRALPIATGIKVSRPELTVIASGGSNQTTDYAFVDSRPFEGLNRYRLLVTDMEGRTSLSTIASVHHGSALSDAQVAPNPAQGGTLVRFQAADDGMMEMSLVDPTGRTVRQARIAVVQGRNEVPLSVHGLAQGQYNLVLSANGAPMARIRLAVAE